MEQRLVDLANFRAKSERNARVQARYDAMMAAGKRGHYETMFRVVREEIEAERERCAKVAEAIDSGRGNEKEIARAIRGAVGDPAHDATPQTVASKGA